MPHLKLSISILSLKFCNHLRQITLYLILLPNLHNFFDYKIFLMDMNHSFFTFFPIWPTFADKGHCDMSRVNVFKYLCTWLCRSH